MFQLKPYRKIRRPAPHGPGSARRRSARTLAAAAASTMAALSWTIATPGTATAACSSIPSTADPEVTLAVYGVGRELGVSSKVMLAGFEAGWIESHLNNLN